MKSAIVRNTFLDFFKSKGHSIVKPAPIVPQNDPSLLFTNAGMNQFKDVFLGEGTREYTRAANSQLCIRVSGKHNDLEDVGTDRTHLTLFEMLGNWSFGDYYKTETIRWAWELLTEKYNIPKEQLYVTVYESDEETETLWKQCTDVNPAHIFKCGAKDNFWEMADVGPCGPCTELHIDLDPSDKTPVNQAVIDSDRFIEIWNLVFIQFNRQADGSLADLPKKHVDTGMGLERLTAFLTGTPSNYMTDLFLPIIHRVEEISKSAYEDSIKGMSHRVLADHIRALSVGVAHNVLPSNEGRGYVLRRLLRRALRYAQKLNIHDPILYQLVPVVASAFGPAFPEIGEREKYIQTVIHAEEEAFLRTLESGVKHFESAVKDIKNNIISGENAFKLYDTYGFPLDLTELMAREKGLSVDVDAFNTALNVQREKSRKSKNQTQSSSGSGLENGPVISDSLHAGVYKTAPGGGEARLSESEAQSIGMARHHSATHLLHDALRHTLGEHVQQAGSLVDEDRLRFDFTHFNALTPQQIRDVEDQVNDMIQKDHSVDVSSMPLEEAKQQGAMALFGEKYDDIVRVVKMGQSIELCGGTHVKHTGQIEAFKIISESAISAGTRRMEALAGHEAIQRYIDSQKEKVIDQLRAKWDALQSQRTRITQMDPKTQSESLPLPWTAEMSLEELQKQLESILNQAKETEKTLQQLQQKNAHADVDALIKQMRQSEDGRYRVIGAHLDNGDIGYLKTLSDQLVNQTDNLIVLLTAQTENKGVALVRLSKPLSHTLKAGQILSALTDIAGGNGGGRPDMAQAGGADPHKLETAISQVSQQLLSGALTG